MYDYVIKGFVCQKQKKRTTKLVYTIKSGLNRTPPPIVFYLTILVTIVEVSKHHLLHSANLTKRNV